MTYTKYCCSRITKYFQEYNLIFFSVKERHEGRKRGMIEGRFIKSKKKNRRKFKKINTGERKTESSNNNLRVITLMHVLYLWQNTRSCSCSCCSFVTSRHSRRLTAFCNIKLIKMSLKVSVESSLNTGRFSITLQRTRWLLLFG